MRYSSTRLDPVKPSASAWVSHAAKVAKSRGEDVIDLGLGEPDFGQYKDIVPFLGGRAVAVFPHLNCCLSGNSGASDGPHRDVRFQTQKDDLNR